MSNSVKINTANSTVSNNAASTSSQMMSSSNNNEFVHMGTLKSQLSNDSSSASSPLPPPPAVSPNLSLADLSSSLKMKNSANYFTVIRSNSVPDVNASENNGSVTSGSNENLSFIGNNAQKNSNNTNISSNANGSGIGGGQTNTSLHLNSNYYFRNPNSIESIAVPSPAGSLEQFDVTTTPLSADDTSDTSIIDSLK